MREAQGEIMSVSKPWFSYLSADFCPRLCVEAQCEFPVTFGRSPVPAAPRMGRRIEFRDEVNSPETGVGHQGLQVLRVVDLSLRIGPPLSHLKISR